LNMEATVSYFKTRLRVKRVGFYPCLQVTVVHSILVWYGYKSDEGSELALASIEAEKKMMDDLEL
jgi:hypothetical protein